MKLVILLITFSFLLDNSKDQTDWQKLIVGKWEGVSKVMMEEGDTVDYTLDQKGYTNDELLEFGDNGYLKVFPDTETSYEVDGNRLRMGNRVYEIKQINNDKMVITIEALDEDTEFWLTFKRINS